MKLVGRERLGTDSCLDDHASARERRVSAALCDGAMVNRFAARPALLRVFPLQDLAVGLQALAERRVFDFLRRHAGVNRQASGCGRRLAGAHEDRLHPDAREGRVTGGKRERDEQIVALRGLGDDGTVADLVGAEAAAAACRFPSRMTWPSFTIRRISCVSVP